MEEFQKKFGIKDISTLHIRNALNEERGILSFSQEVDAQMVALVTYRRRGISTVFS
ncbi:hypothetical protein QWY93_08860 [Echinicola jeungdonensis]|uniref:Uncharacterized protein n=1 Tax=Echinicola jeungdonensis TaxID=709343 RepID=A0ABV5J9F5_9BACT|nr:hypothetical protein [Echinicola jeungdonensis]MDN3669439.1 hypothetical protein [Echinicola jeungdonensis]